MKMGLHIDPKHGVVFVCVFLLTPKRVGSINQKTDPFSETQAPKLPVTSMQTGGPFLGSWLERGPPPVWRRVFTGPEN